MKRRDKTRFKCRCLKFRLNAKAFVSGLTLSTHLSNYPIIIFSLCAPPLMSFTCLCPPLVFKPSPVLHCGVLPAAWTSQINHEAVQIRACTRVDNSFWQKRHSSFFSQFKSCILVDFSKVSCVSDYLYMDWESAQGSVRGSKLSHCDPPLMTASLRIASLLFLQYGDGVYYSHLQVRVTPAGWILEASLCSLHVWVYSAAQKHLWLWNWLQSERVCVRLCVSLWWTGVVMDPAVASRTSASIIWMGHNRGWMYVVGN